MSIQIVRKSSKTFLMIFIKVSEILMKLKDQKIVFIQQIIRNNADEICLLGIIKRKIQRLFFQIFCGDQYGQLIGATASGVGSATATYTQDTSTSHQFQFVTDWKYYSTKTLTINNKAFLRSVMDLKTSPKVPVNLITTWIDGSTAYGSIQSHAKELRAFQFGFLKSKGPRSEQLLPPGPQANSTKFSNRFLSNETMKSGDTRSNENLILLSIHTIFLREHNRICDLLRSKNKTLSDDQLYTIAKNYITALIQKITYDDYLPTLLGKEGYEKFIGPYAGYSENSDPSLTVEFTTAGYRIGHSLLIPKLPLVNIFGQNFLSLSLDNIFFRPDLLDAFNLQKILKGASRAVTKLRDGQFINEVRNLLVVHLSQETQKWICQPLIFNEEEIMDYQCFGLKRLSTFKEISDDNDKNEKISSVYKSIDIIDSYVGIQAQKGIAGSILGETGIQIVGQQFQRIRSADRFWYEKVLPEEIVSQIKATKFSHVIFRNTNIGELQEDVFHYSFG